MKHKNNNSKIARSINRIMVSSLKQCTPVRVFIKNKKALSPVISNLILIAAVIVLGFAVFAYARDISSDYQADYQRSVSSDIDQLKETLGFEFVYYNNTGASPHVQVYFLNAGTITFEVDKVYLSTSTNNLTYTIKYMNGTATTGKNLGVSEERQIAIQQSLSPGQTYTMKVTTIRGSSFAYSFSI